MKALGEVSPLPEQFGGDFAYITKHGLVLVQRKETSDYVSSKRGDRLGRLLSDMASGTVKQAVMLIEGSWPWEKGRPLWGKFSYAEWESDELKLQSLGLILVRTKTIEETATKLLRMETYFCHADADTLLRVPKARAPKHLRPMMACDGVSLTKARSLDEAGVHLVWSHSEEEVAALKGWGKVSAKKLGAFIKFRDANGYLDRS